jgi:hypothetical protein
MLTLDPRFPWEITALLALIASAATLYYGAIVGGWYKNPLMGRFRRYGREERPSPLGRFFDLLGLSGLLFTLMTDSLRQSSALASAEYLPAVLLVFTVAAWSGSVAVRANADLSTSLPRWYFDLVRTASRQERRFIGWAWLRIPTRMRWRLNGDQASFQVWADMVRITVIYGARDPDDPWGKWT